MDAEEFMKLFDSCWFEVEILSKKPPSSNSSIFEPNTNKKIQENPSKPKFLRNQTIHVRSMSDQWSYRTVKEISEENQILVEVNEKQSRKNEFSSRRSKKGTGSKSLSELEFEELKGFMDLGFVFSEEDKDSRLAAIVPGLQRFGKKNGTEEDDEVSEDESAISRPYLSEAWEVLERRKKEKPLMNCRIPALSNEIDMKDNLRWWAHTVASIVR